MPTPVAPRTFLTVLTLTVLTPTLASMARELAVAARSFERTLEELGVSERDLGDPTEVGRRAALLAAAGWLWKKHLGPILDREQAQQLLGVRSRQAVSELAKRRRLLALPTSEGRLTFPAFQFTTSGRPYAAMPAILAAFETAEVDPYTIASWFVTPQRLLRGTPVSWLRRGGDPERAIEAARRTGARLAQ